MEWKIDYLEEEGVVLIKTSGFITWDENKQMCIEAFDFACNHNCHKYLVDNRDLETGLSVLQVDGLPKMFKEIGVGSGDKIAILYEPSNENKFKFFQSVSNIAFLNLQIFTSWDGAMEWLKSGKLQQSMLSLP